jgi:hypothetical protein
VQCAPAQNDFIGQSSGMDKQLYAETGGFKGFVDAAALFGLYWPMLTESVPQET